MGTMHLEADTRETLETELGDLQDMHLGRVRWTIAERAAGWTCDGQDGCREADEPDRKPTHSGNQLGLDL
jgi:hypothetical protein